MQFPRLVIETGPLVEQEYVLRVDNVVVGRDPQADWVLGAPQVSRRHLRVYRQESQFWVEDLGSVNGTYLNGQRLIAPQVLNPNDVLKLSPEVAVRFLKPEGGLGIDQTLVRAPQSFSEKPGEFQKPADSPTEPPALVVQVAGEPAQTFKLDRESYTVGRAPDNDLLIASPLISRYHATLNRTAQGYRLTLKPTARNPLLFKGTLLKESLDLHDGDVLRLGSANPGMMVTITYESPAEAMQRRYTHALEFGEKTRLQFGSDPQNDVTLASPAVSAFHAVVERVGQRVRVQDLNSATGTFVNDERVSHGDVWLKTSDVIRIGPYRYVLGSDQFSEFDEAAGVRVEVLGLNKWVSKERNVLQDISLAIEPREFVVVVGQSGGGKSSLIDALAGYRSATQGQVFVNGRNSYRNPEAIRNDIGFVPQRDIIHTELTAAEALDYSAKLRLPKGTSAAERKQRVTEVLADLDLTDRQDQPIHTLSGGQQKRVSIGVELLNRPGLFFLDEPTSGLDPTNETALMNLMRRLADQGRTIILVTHATRNVMLADKVIFLARGGHLAFFGPPDEALKYFDQYRLNREQHSRPMEFDEIYAILDDPSKGAPQDWANRFREHAAYRQYITEPLQRHGHVLPSLRSQPKAQGAALATPVQPRKKIRRISSIGQFLVLSARNLKILQRDRTSLTLMLAAPPIVAAIDLSSAFLLGRNVFDFREGDMYNAITSFFMSLMYAALVGAFSQMREFVKESDIYRRERLVTLRVWPYVFSKIWLASILAFYQAVAFTLIHHLAYNMPGGLLEILLFFITIYLASFAGMIAGLFASALSPNANSAPLVVVMLVVPQLVMAGAMLPVPEWVSAFTPTRWAYQTLIGISGAGSTVAADACWALPKAERDALDLQTKNARGCQCMGSNVLRESSCTFPGVGEHYVAAIDQPEPVKPPPLGNPPAEPSFPTAPEPPADLTDLVSLGAWLQDLSTFQSDAEQIRADFSQQLRNYQAQADAYETALEVYLDERAKWETERNQAVGKAEGEIEFFYKNYSWTFVDKTDTPAYWGKTVLGWGMILLIVNVFIGLTLVLMWRKN